MQYGIRLIFDKKTGKILNGTFGKMNGDLQENLRPKKIDFIDLEYEDTTLENALDYHVDVETKKIVVDKYREHIETNEEKVVRLEDELLISKGVI